MKHAFAVLTHDLHHSVSQEGPTALQVPEAFDVQRPDVSGGIAVRHPLRQILSSSPSEGQAGGIHPGQHIVPRDPRGLPHQAAHVRGKGLWTVDQLMDLS